MARIAEVALFTEDVAGLTAHGAPNADHVAFALDQDDAAERMRSSGVDVAGPREFYWGRSAYLRDPDGRALELQAES
jgi:predicted enzyme related to lactoylglutathione lyase